MHSYESVIHQLERLGVRPGRIFLGELRELPRILLPDEVIEQYMTGRYDAGPAIMVATNRRMILIDKKPLNLTIEDISYDMINEIEYTVQAFNAYISVYARSKTIRMMSFRQSNLRRFAGFLQARVMQIKATQEAAINQPQQMYQPQFYGDPSHQIAAQQYYSQPYTPTTQQ